jgi:hypothetical protein
VTYPDVAAGLAGALEALEALNVPFYVCDSIASSAHGELRLTLDAEVVADLQPQHAEKLVQILGADYYADAEAILEAIRSHSSFNLLHFGTFLKVDVFAPKDRAYDRVAMQRRRSTKLGQEPDALVAPVASPEDTLLAKLEWFRMGGEVSDRQWRDIMGICKTQRDSLDFAYLRRWARELNVGDLLERAFTDSGLTEDGWTETGIETDKDKA